MDRGASRRVIERSRLAWDVGRDVLEEMRVLVVAGIPIGVVVAGAGSRLAMLVLRLTSPDRVRGVTSDDGFTIGEVTLSGTYGLLLLGAVVGIVGAAAYQWVSPWLLGPVWFRRVTVGLAAGVVVGSMLVHPDGVDFVLLEPLWLAIGLFVALPAVFGVAIGVAVDRVSAPGSWTARGRRRWVLPLLVLLAFPFVALPLAVAALVLVGWVVVRRHDSVGRARRSPVVAAVARIAWLGIAVVGLAALVSDVRALA